MCAQGSESDMLLYLQPRSAGRSVAYISCAALGCLHQNGVNNKEGKRREAKTKASRAEPPPPSTGPSNPQSHHHDTYRVHVAQPATTPINSKRVRPGQESIHRSRHVSGAATTKKGRQEEKHEMQKKTRKLHIPHAQFVVFPPPPPTSRRRQYHEFQYDSHLHHSIALYTVRVPAHYHRLPHSPQPVTI